MARNETIVSLRISDEMDRRIKESMEEAGIELKSVFIKMVLKKYFDKKAEAGTNAIGI